MLRKKSLLRIVSCDITFRKPDKLLGRGFLQLTNTPAKWVDVTDTMKSSGVTGVNLLQLDPWTLRCRTSSFMTVLQKALWLSRADRNNRWGDVWGNVVIAWFRENRMLIKTVNFFRNIAFSIYNNCKIAVLFIKVLNNKQKCSKQKRKTITNKQTSRWWYHVTTTRQTTYQTTTTLPELRMMSFNWATKIVPIQSWTVLVYSGAKG